MISQWERAKVPSSEASPCAHVGCGKRLFRGSGRTERSSRAVFPHLSLSDPLNLHPWQVEGGEGGQTLSRTSGWSQARTRPAPVIQAPAEESLLPANPGPHLKLGGSSGSRCGGRSSSSSSPPTKIATHRAHFNPPPPEAPQLLWPHCWVCLLCPRKAVPMCIF